MDAAYYGHEVKDNEEPHGSISQRILLVGKNSKMNSANSPSPSAKYLEKAERMDEISRSVPAAKGVFQKIKLRSLIGTRKEWIKDPSNVAILLWITCVTVSGGVLFLVMTGMLNNSLPSKSERDAWFEVNNQILNALFTLMCLYHHPKRFHHLILLCRWEPKDILILRKTYCKNGTCKPHEWTHMMIQLVLLHINCFAQYALCGLNLGYRKSQRPAAGVAVCLTVAISAAAAAGLYSIFSPLGKEYNCDNDEENQNQILRQDSKESCNRRAKSFQPRIVHKPEWRGGLFHFLDDINTACLSVCCSFCLFGWNMERLGLGNKYVHTITFAIFCTAPLLLFGLAANVVDYGFFKVAFGLIGILVSIFGLLYGGYWRIQMRKRFNLEKNNSCCGKPNVADFAQWLFCCCCSIAQEVRTADYYEIMEDKFCKKQRNDEGMIESLFPLPREGEVVRFRSNLGSAIWDNTILSEIKTGIFHDSNKLSDDTDKVKQVMKPPAQSISMHRDSEKLSGILKENRSQEALIEKYSNSGS